LATISATFTNNSGSSRKWVILDIGRDPNAPPVLFDDYLDPGQATQALSLYSDIDGAKALYQRSDGAPTNVNVSDGDNVQMS